MIKSDMSCFQNKALYKYCIIIQCVLGVAHRNNKVTQRAIAEENAFGVLVSLFLNPPNQNVQVEVAYTIGCLVLGNHENQELLKETDFSYLILVQLLNEADPVSI